MDWLEEFWPVILVLVIGAALIALLVHAGNKFEDDCHARHGYVVSTPDGFIPVSVSCGEKCAMWVPVQLYDTRCVVPVGR